jgi:hypothetical protein
MADPVSMTISVLSLAMSSVTAWLTLFRRGTVRMTQPTVIYSGPDSPRGDNPTPAPKVYLRSLLFSTYLNIETRAGDRVPVCCALTQ